MSQYRKITEEEILSIAGKLSFWANNDVEPFQNYLETYHPNWDKAIFHVNSCYNDSTYDTQVSELQVFDGKGKILAEESLSSLADDESFSEDNDIRAREKYRDFSYLISEETNDERGEFEIVLEKNTSGFPVKIPDLYVKEESE